MKKIFLTFIIIFTILTFVGAICVIRSGGTLNAGYAVVPCVIAIALQSVYSSIFKKKE